MKSFGKKIHHRERYLRPRRTSLSSSLSIPFTSPAPLDFPSPIVRRRPPPLARSSPMRSTRPSRFGSAPTGSRCRRGRRPSAARLLARAAVAGVEAASSGALLAVAELLVLAAIRRRCGLLESPRCGCRLTSDAAARPHRVSWPPPQAAELPSMRLPSPPMLLLVLAVICGRRCGLLDSDVAACHPRHPSPEQRGWSSSSPPMLGARPCLSHVAFDVGCSTSTLLLASSSTPRLVTQFGELCWVRPNKASGMWVALEGCPRPSERKRSIDQTSQIERFAAGVYSHRMCFGAI